MQGSHFPGLMPLVFAYLDIIACDADSRLTIEAYMRLIVDRAQGTLLNTPQASPCIRVCSLLFRGLVRRLCFVG